MFRINFIIAFLFATILTEATENRAQDIQVICNKFQMADKTQLQEHALAVLERSEKTMDVSSLISKMEEAINEKRVQERIREAFSGFTDEELGALRAIYESPVYQKVSYQLFVSLANVIQSKMNELLELHGEAKKTPEQSVPEIIEVTEENFCSEILLSKQPLVIDFYTSRCVPCRVQAKILDALNRKYGKAIRIAKVNCDQQRRLAEYFQIQGVPSLLFFKSGEGLPVANRIVGLLPEEDLDKELLKFQ